MVFVKKNESPILFSFSPCIACAMTMSFRQPKARSRRSRQSQSQRSDPALFAGQTVGPVRALVVWWLRGTRIELDQDRGGARTSVTRPREIPCTGERQPWHVGCSAGPVPLGPCHRYTSTLARTYFIRVISFRMLTQIFVEKTTGQILNSRFVL
jgi:hypothetical protein